MKKAVGYARVSTEKESQEPSLRHQEDIIQEYCKEEGYQLEKVFKEKVSGSKTPLKREKYKKMNEYTQEKPINCIVFKSRDRFGREPAHLMIEKDRLEDKGIEMEAVDDTLEFGENIQEMITIIRSYVDKEERKKAIEKIKNTIKNKKRKGEPLGRPLYGLEYNKDKTKLVPGEKFEKVKKAIRKRGKGKSYTQLEKELGISKGTLHRILNENKDRYTEFIEKEES